MRAKRARADSSGLSVTATDSSRAPGARGVRVVNQRRGFLSGCAFSDVLE